MKKIVFFVFFAFSFAGYSQIVTDPIDPDDPIDPPVYPLETFYYDGDGDGYGNPNITTQAYFAPLNYVSNADDYDDSDPEINVEKYWYIDNDGDGYGDMASQGIIALLPPSSNYVGNNNDCDDSSTVVQNNCERRKVYVDNDGDGYGGEEFIYVVVTDDTPAGYACNNLDENDSNTRERNKEPLYSQSACSPSPVHASTFYEDLDGDGIGTGPGFKSAAGDMGPIPSHFVTQYGDADDNNPNVGKVYLYLDEDQDSYGDMTATIVNGRQILLAPKGETIELEPVRIFPTPISGCLYRRMTSNYRGLVFEPPGEEDGEGEGEGETLYGHPIPAGYVANHSDCDDHDPYVHNNCPDFDDENYIYTKTYGVDRLLTRDLGYFNALGKNYMNYSWQAHQWNLLWASQTSYDEWGRPAIQSFRVPIGSTRFGPTPASWWSSQTTLMADYLSLVNNTLNYNSLAQNTTGLAPDYYNDTSTTQFVGFPGGPGMTIQESSYRAEADYPYARTVYDHLNPGRVVKQIGGNKIDGKWKSGFSYSMPATQELYYAFGLGYFKENIPSDVTIGVSGGKALTLKAIKNISMDADGKTSVVFTDLEGKVLATARSGTSGPKKTVVSSIGEQGYVDIHIGEGCGGQITYYGGAHNYKVFDLQTRNLVTSATNLPPGFYRMEYTGN
jgi:hypothetical protein